MSTQTGIRANDQLEAFFGKCKDGRYRLLKVIIKDEALCLDTSYEAQASWEHDWDRLVLAAVEDSQPCYLLFRLDERDGTTFRWLLISWSPDSSSIRNKMLYASTKATLKKEFGGGQIKDDLYGNVLEDISLDGYKKHLVSAAAPGPLSREEQEREEVKAAQNQVAVSVDTKHQMMGGIAFPLTSPAEAAIHEILSKHVEYVQLSIDTTKEVICLEEKEVACHVNQLPSKAIEDAPRYHLFIFKHTHEGDYLESFVFIYTMPGYNCSIKERMLYSSCKNALVDRLERMGMNIEKKVEVDSGSELTESFLQGELHPAKNLNRPKFAKPAPPSRSGQRRITKAPRANNNS